MKSITEIDKNFSQSAITKEDIKYYNIKEKPFKIYGLYEPLEDGGYKRLPDDVAKNVNAGVAVLYRCTTGGRVRFKTNSEYIAIKAIFPKKELHMPPQMSVVGSNGFDIYIDGHHAGAYVPKIEYPDGCTPKYSMDGGYDAIKEFKNNGMKDVIINFPIFGEVEELFIGLQEDALVLEGDKYRNEKPIVYYGSSITHGACASRPGNTYQNILSRWLNCDFINLGFSGNARAEDAIAEYISNLDMSVFVYDYDHNAPSVEHLRKTHEKMFKKIREKHPNLPVIMASRPNNAEADSIQERIEIIKETYNNAKKTGDNNVYFINGQDIFNEIDPDILTVEGTHPNDFGFYCMAKVFREIIEKVI